MVHLTLPEKQDQVHEEDEDFQEQETRSELHELKITAQVIGYHALKFLLPTVAISITLGCGITLSVWALNQLNKLPIQAFPASTAAVDKNNLDSNKRNKANEITPGVVHATTAPKKVRKAKVQAQAKQNPHKYPQRRSVYQDPWADYYYYEPSHPRGGEITHSDGMVTEYRWNKKH
ncbi:MAG: hypothetical protein SFY67_06465 [Candidatus Melainabacteria bacterium]|nr:hypothetical protein [Candidatus Melainabacteria bacterium]